MEIFLYKYAFFLVCLKGSTFMLTLLNEIQHFSKLSEIRNISQLFFFLPVIFNDASPNCNIAITDSHIETDVNIVITDGKIVIANGKMVIPDGKIDITDVTMLLLTVKLS